MLVLSSPSGAGKTTLARKLLEADPEIEMSVSVTTRKPRRGEVDGKDYHFIDRERFAAMRDADELLEWALVFDNFYGTPKAPVQQALNRGRDILFDIDWQGAQQLGKGEAKPDLVTVFILPPSVEALEQRLRTRAQDSDDIVRQRMAGAVNEIRHWNEYDYIIVNHDVDSSLRALCSILLAERSRRERLRTLSDFVRQLESEL